MSKAYGLALLAIAFLGGASVLAIELSTRVRAPDGEQGGAAASARAPADAAPAVAASPPPAHAAPPAPYATPSPAAAYPAVGALQYAPVPGTPGAFASGDDADVESERAERLAKRGRARRPRGTASPE
jgi:hypothetical protein